MKLRNKRTGEIVEPFGITCINGRTFVQFDDGAGTFKFEARSLAELNEEWEDYEEPKDSALDLMILTLTNFIENEPDEDKVDLDDCKQMLEKLKAWKRLKEKGFRFIGIAGLSDNLYFGVNDKYRNCHVMHDEYNDDELEEYTKDLHLLFGGEE